MRPVGLFDGMQGTVQGICLSWPGTVHRRHSWYQWWPHNSTQATLWHLLPFPELTLQCSWPHQPRTLRLSKYLSPTPSLGL